MTLTEYTNYLFHKSANKGIPLSGTFELTSRCNLDCRMCYIHRRENDAEAMKSELPAKEWLKIAEEAVGHGMLFVLLTGGEPLLRPDFPEIYVGCRKLGLMVSVNTNGTLIDEKIADLFAAYPPIRVNITLYGSSPATYEKLCGHPAAFDRVMNGIRLLEERKIPMKLNHTVTPYNVNDTEEIYRFGDAHGIWVLTSAYLFPPLRACGTCAQQNARLEPEEAARVRFGFDCRRFEPDEISRRAGALLAGQRVSDPDRECGDQPTERISCRAGETTFWLTCSGELRPCGMMDHPTVPVGNDFIGAWNRIRTEREKLMVPAKCTSCPDRAACDICPASAYAETGCYSEAPEYHCRMTGAFINILRQWKERENGNETES